MKARDETTRDYSHGEPLHVSSDAGGADGSSAVGVNRADTPQSLSIAWSEIGLTGDLRLRDVWNRTDLGNARTSLDTALPAHGAVLLKVRTRAPHSPDR